jgi:uncharacterized protein
MPTDHIRYDVLAQAALRGVVRTVLEDVAQKGLPGEHHFKITFATAAPGVRLSERMRAQYPQAMTIVLQHQFWDLMVREEAFDVGLSFGGVPEKLTVPFEAVMAFYDPAVQFGFQFETVETEATDDADGAAPSPDRPPHTAIRPPTDDKKAAASATPAAVEGEKAPPGRNDGSGAEVVSLDRFRKK